MKKISFITIITLLCFLSVNAQTKARSQKSVAPSVHQFLQNKQDSVSYAFGVYVGNDFARNLKTFPGMQINTDILLKGMRQAFEGDSVPMSVEFANQYFQQYIAMAQQQDAAVKQAEGQAFLDKNKQRPEVKVTPSGLQYEVITQTDGPKPSATDNVKVHYTGKLIDGTVFDSSIDRGEPITFPLNAVIPGWTEGVQMMSIGSKYRFFIPYNLAYGERGSGPIPPFATLIFDVELLDINPAQPEPAQ
jgi:FKBP-type peptidyl-prolyl cis-trans isomerase